MGSVRRWVRHVDMLDMPDNQYHSTIDPHFETIRPFTDAEVHDAIVELLRDEEFRHFADTFGFDLSPESETLLSEQVRSIFDFKRLFISAGLSGLLDKTTFSTTISGTSNLDREGSTKYLLVSNHRDIILDSAILDLLFLQSGLSMPRMTLGDNLLKRPWIRTLVRLCDGVVVKRGLPVRETLLESKRLSEYIRTAVEQGEEHIWLAQRDGRAKDSNDTTQPGLLKMLTLSAPRGASIAESIESLHFVPMAISYEYDPCDALKAVELLARRRNPDYQKQPTEDLVSMRTGLGGRKGRVHIKVAEPLHDLASLYEPEASKNEQLAAIAREIDRQIFLSYRFYPSNYIAYDIVRGGDQFDSMYSRKERLLFELYVEEQMDAAKVATKDREEVAHMIFDAYANPLVNNLITRKIIRR